MLSEAIGLNIALKKNKLYQLKLIFFTLTQSAFMCEVARGIIDVTATLRPGMPFTVQVSPAKKFNKS